MRLSIFRAIKYILTALEEEEVLKAICAQGDFVDRGYNSVETFTILMLLKARCFPSPLCPPQPTPSLHFVSTVIANLNPSAVTARALPEDPRPTLRDRATHSRMSCSSNQHRAVRAECTRSKAQKWSQESDQEPFKKALKVYPLLLDL